MCSLELSHILVDQSVRNAVLWRVDSAIEEGHTILMMLDAFAARCLLPPRSLSLSMSLSLSLSLSLS